MSGATLGAIALRVGIALRAAGPVGIGAALVLAASAAALGWILPERAARAQQHRAVLAQAAAAPAPVLVQAAAPQTAAIEAFYKALGERRYAEQQVRTLFGLADKAGLVLARGEYRAAYDRNARVYAYQVTLPVRGPYKAVWGFAMSSLATIPFASLDEISFKRESVGDPDVDARLRLTLYLNGGAP
ncbi:hypothetical protein [Pseudoduganella sp. GCM10020061]|uniref:hypothetical protein n=1 Tax=Pseudoduganella sp. GCM10020061 TaxID=3317345 RepID=UPI00363FCAA8